MAQAFAGIRVVDFTQVLSGPYASLQMALQGADVVKTEAPGIGDQMRDRLLPSKHMDKKMASGFLALNHSKRSLAVDLKHPRGLEIAHELIRGADVMVHNLRGGVAERIGIDYDTAKGLNEKLVYCAISGYGATGPKAHEPAYDGAIQAATGMMANNGTPESGPLRTGYFPVDMFTGMTAAFAISSALLRREREGLGQYIDVAMADCALGLLAAGVGMSVVDGLEAGLLGNRSPADQPTGDSFETGDGSILMSAVQQNQVQALCEGLGVSHLLQDPRYADPKSRTANRDSMRAELLKALAKDSAANWTVKLSGMGVPVAKVNTIAEAIQTEQSRTRDIMQKVSAPWGIDEGMELPGTGFMTRTDGPASHSPPPGLGEQSIGVLNELGISGDEIEKLLADGVIGVPAD